MQFLLVTEQQVATGETSCTLGALEGLLLGVGTLVAFKMLETGEGALAGAADVRAGLIGLGRREIRGRLGVDGDGGCCRC